MTHELMILYPVTIYSQLTFLCRLTFQFVINSNTNEDNEYKLTQDNFNSHFALSIKWYLTGCIAMSDFKIL